MKRRFARVAPLGALFLAPAVEARTMTSSTLSTHDQSLALIGALTATGDQERLKTVLNEGLDAGLTVNQIKEAQVQLYAYAGFPRSLSGLGSFMEVLEAREGQGIHDLQGEAGHSVPPDRSLALGTEVQTRLVGQPVTGPVYTFAPAIDTFLKAHLFGDIFGRGVLSDQQRETVTIGALASLGGVDAQLSGHYAIGLNVGLSPAQLQGIVAAVTERVGQTQGQNAGRVLEQVLEAKK